MYLSRVKVDHKNRQRIKDLSHLGAYHNWVEQSFPDEIKANNRKRHLWRLDRLGSEEYLLILSEEEPHLVQLEQYGVEGSAQIKSYDNFINQLTEGTVAQFRLTANPVRSIVVEGTRGKVSAHVTPFQQVKWLVERSEKLGFEILTDQGASTPNRNQVNMDEGQASNLLINIVNRDYPILRKKGSRSVRISRVSFEGTLKILDLERFKYTLLHGIGREKAYGMGLLTIIPESN